MLVCKSVSHSKKKKSFKQSVSQFVYLLCASYLYTRWCHSSGSIISDPTATEEPRLPWICLGKKITVNWSYRLKIDVRTQSRVLSPVQTDATMLTNNSQNCWMLHVLSVCTPCCMLLDVVARCWAKFETGQTFQPTTSNISFLPWSPKLSATMLDPFAQLFQHFWGRARSLRMVYKDLCVVSFPRCNAAPNIVGSCCIRLHTTANMHAALTKGGT